MLASFTTAGRSLLQQSATFNHAPIRRHALRYLPRSTTVVPLDCRIATVYRPISIAIAALIFGKAVLIADMLPIINRFPHKPLIYNIAWKTLIYLLISLVIHYLERLVDFWRQAGGFFAGNQKLLAEIVWPHFWAIQIILFMLVAMYCTMHELVRVIGKEKAMRIFFGPMPAPQV